MKQLNVEVNDKLHKDLKILAAHNGTSVKAIVVQVLQDYFNQLKDGGVD